MLKDNEFKCEACGGVFEKGWTDNEAHQEKLDNFGDLPIEECALICDNCYHVYMFWMECYGLLNGD